ncbi:MAG: hypothetical protein GEU73_04500 [Chloroflexi bacterium]|nr:hypothetical protein [Chloroflexota bacterium]
MTRYQVDKVLRQVINDDTALEAFQRDAAAFLEGRDLSDEERKGLIDIDYPALYKLGAHPFILSGFTMRVWPADRRGLQAEYQERIAPHGYPDFET